MAQDIFSKSNSASDPTATNAVGHLKGKYLTYAVSEEVYGIAVLKVIEIISIMNITAVPRTPEYLKGVINLRGRIIPVIDLRIKLGMESLEYNSKTCIVVVEFEQEEQTAPIGIIVDTVLEVVDFDSSTLAPAPEFGLDCSVDFIAGMGRVAEEQLVILIDIDAMLAANRIEIANVTAELSSFQNDSDHE